MYYAALNLVKRKKTNVGLVLWYSYSRHSESLAVPGQSTEFVKQEGPEGPGSLT